MVVVRGDKDPIPTSFLSLVSSRPLIAFLYRYKARNNMLKRISFFISAAVPGYKYLLAMISRQGNDLSTNKTTVTVVPLSSGTYIVIHLPEREKKS